MGHQRWDILRYRMLPYLDLQAMHRITADLFSDDLITMAASYASFSFPPLLRGNAVGSGGRQQQLFMCQEQGWLKLCPDWQGKYAFARSSLGTRCNMKKAAPERVFR